MHQEVAWFRGRGLTATPWGFFAAFDGPARAIACARALASASPRFGRVGHFGLHTGECDVTREGRVAGLAFDRAHGVSRVAKGGEVLVSRTVTDLVAGSGVAFVERGTHPLTADGDPSTLFAAVAGSGRSAAAGQGRRAPEAAAPPCLRPPWRRRNRDGRRCTHGGRQGGDSRAARWSFDVLRSAFFVLRSAFSPFGVRPSAHRLEHDERRT